MVDQAEFDAIAAEAFSILRRVHAMRERKAEAEEKAFVEGLEFWARAVARRVGHDQWDKMAWHANDALPEFDGDAVRFFENLFEGMTLADGHDVWP